MDDYRIQRGQRLLSNWGDWCAGDTARRLEMPRESPFARMYVPDLGDVWQEEPEPVEIPPNDDEAALVERAVLALVEADRLLLYYAYVLKYPVTTAKKTSRTLVRRMRMDEESVKARLARLEGEIGKLKS